MRPALPVLLVVAACRSGDGAVERHYAHRVADVLRSFEQVQARTAEVCNAGPVECSVEAQHAADALHRSRAQLATLTPPEKLRDAHRRLLAGFDHLAQAYDTIADTYWDRSDLLGAYTRSIRSMENAVKEIGAAGVLIGFKGDGEIWQAAAR